MGRHRKHATNADRQRAYRRRVTKNAAKPVTIPWFVQASADDIRSAYDAGCSVDFLRRRYATQCRVIRAVLAMTPSKPRVPKTEAEAAEIRKLVERRYELWPEDGRCAA